MVRRSPFPECASAPILRIQRHVMPLAGGNKEAVLKELIENASRLRGMVTRKIVLHQSQNFLPRIPPSEAGRIKLLQSERVQADVNKP